MNPTPGKLCKFCAVEKPLTSYSKNKSQKDGYHYYCRACTKIIRDNHQERHPGYYRDYREKNKEKIKEYHREYRKKKSGVDTQDKNRRKQREKSKNPKYIAARRTYFKNKYQTDIQFKLKKQFESKLNRLLTDNDNTEKSISLLGLTIPEFKAYLEAKWLPGMEWSNYGTEWNLDRITPFCDFNLCDAMQAQSCNHYTNIQPLFIQTKMIDGVEHIGNANKNKY